MSSFLKNMWDNKEDVVGGLFDMFSEENVKQNIDENWSSLENIGISEGLLQGKATTTEADFSKSLGNTIYNLPSQVPRVAKDVVGAIYNPIETIEALHGAGQGIMTNASDVFYDAVLPDSLFNLLKENQPEEITRNEKAMEFAGEALLDPQVRREIFQQYGIDGLIGIGLLPKNFLTLSKAQQKAFASVIKDVDLDLNNLKSSTIPGSPNNLLRMFAEPRFGMMIGEQGAIRLGKSTELDKAKKLHSEGVDAETIWKETGFALAQDGKWRTEIDDSGASLKDISEHPMDKNLVLGGEKVIDHEGLLTAYPELKELDVYPYKFNLDPSTFGYYAEKGGIPEIGLNPVSRKTVEEYSLDDVGKANLKKGKTLHEFQHAVQGIEGHSGGTSQVMEAGKVRLEESLPDLRAQITNIDLQLNALDSSKGSDLAQIYPLLNRKTELEKELVKQDQYISDKGYENYKKTLGESEAFQTQGDVALTAEERASRLPAYLLDDEARFADSALALVNDGLLSDIKPNTLMKSGDFKRRKDGTYVGFSKSINTPQKLNKLIAQIDSMATEGADARFWYEDSSNQILNLVKGDKVEAEKIAQILAITSQDASVQTNTGFAFKAYMQHKAGLPIESGRYPVAQSKKIVDVLNGIPWEGRKTNSFYENLMTEIDPTKVTANTTTQDLWMARAFGLDSTVPGSGQYEVMEKITQSIATKNGWRPHQAQAAVWVAVKARNDAMKSFINAEVKKKGWGNNANDIFPEHQKKFDKFYQTTVYDSEYNLDEFLKASYSFADGIESNLGYINLEAVPGLTTDLLPGIRNAKPEEIASYTKDMYSIFLDENGVDLLAKEIGIVSPDGFMGFGGWEGDINPNIQVRGILSGTISRGINPADKELVQLYASVVGTVFRQDGVSYRRAFADDKVSKQNGVNLDVGRQLTQAEHQTLYDKLIEKFGHTKIQPTSTTDGAQIIQYANWDTGKPVFDMPNKDFHKLVKEAIMESNLSDAMHLGYYRSDGDLLSNNWKESLNGENYRGYVTEKSQDIYRKLVDKYGKEANKINQRYSEEYGW